MTTDLEKQFFDTFGIKPIEYTQCTSMGCRDICGDCNNCQFHNIYKIDYPQITDHILLELICILSEWRTYLHSDYIIKADNVSSLKENVLKDFLELFKWYEFKKCEKGTKQQVQALFKE